MDDLAQEIAKYKIYCSLDLNSAYHQIPIKEDKRYTAFEANGKLYQFCRIPFGVTNGVACFQRIIDKIIKENNLTGVYTYVDNVVVVGKNQQEYDENLEKLRRLLHSITSLSMKINLFSLKHPLIFSAITYHMAYLDLMQNVYDH